MRKMLCMSALIAHVSCRLRFFLRALGFGSDQEILDLIGENEYLRNTLDKDNTENSDKALLEIYERLRPGEPPTVENAKSLLDSRFFDPKRYDLANVGRYKINKKASYQEPPV